MFAGICSPQAYKWFPVWIGIFQSNGSSQFCVEVTLCSGAHISPFFIVCSDFFGVKVAILLFLSKVLSEKCSNLYKKCVMYVRLIPDSFYQYLLSSFRVFCWGPRWADTRYFCILSCQNPDTYMSEDMYWFCHYPLSTL